MCGSFRDAAHAIPNCCGGVGTVYTSCNEYASLTRKRGQERVVWKQNKTVKM